MFQPVIRALDRGPRAGRSGAIVPVADRDRRAAAPRALACAECGHPITTDAARTERAGAHVHERRNPAGVWFRIGCFRDAPGAVAVGEESVDFTWFAGFAWTAAVCTRCGAFLGWRYRSAAAETFFGLILDRLRETGAGGAAGGGEP